jgi:hypothetical protein
VRYDLFVIEVKKPGSTIALGDQRKVAYEFQKMLDYLVEKSAPSPVVCGLWVDGNV